MRHRTIVYGILLMVCLLTGCGKTFDIQETENIKTDEEDLIVVGVSQVGSESVWRTANTTSLQQTFTRENGYLMIFNNARQKQENQIKAIRSFISRGVDYIVFSPITEEGWDTVLTEAKDAGIPVILMDRKIKTEDESLYAAWVGSDFEKEGNDAGKWLEAYLEEQGRKEEVIHILVLLGTQGSSSVLGRLQGFDHVLRSHPNWKVLEYIDADYTTAKANEEMRKALIRYGDIDVVISQNDDMTFGAIEAIEAAGLKPGMEDGEILLVSFDAVCDALKLVQEGTIGVDVECNPNQGGYIDEIIQAMESGYYYEKNTYVKEQTFTRDNVAQYIVERTY